MLIGNCLELERYTPDLSNSLLSQSSVGMNRGLWISVHQQAPKFLLINYSFRIHSVKH